MLVDVWLLTPPCALLTIPLILRFTQDIEVQKAIEALAAQELSDAREAMERAEEQARANERARVEAAEALSRKGESCFDFFSTALSAFAVADRCHMLCALSCFNAVTSWRGDKGTTSSTRCSIDSRCDDNFDSIGFDLIWDQSR